MRSTVKKPESPFVTIIKVPSLESAETVEEASEVSGEDGESCGGVDNLEATLGADEESWPGIGRALICVVGWLLMVGKRRIGCGIGGAETEESRVEFTTGSGFET